jgi:hypothetical protein
MVEKGRYFTDVAYFAVEYLISKLEARRNLN